MTERGASMELYDAIRGRRSTRSFEDRAVPREILGRVLEAARQAPSANNLMPWRLVVVTDAGTRAAIASSGTYGKFLARAPVVIAAVGDAVSSPKWYAVDTAIALEHLALAAVAEGLGTCWVGSFDEGVAHKALGLTEGYRIVALLALGYPKERIDLARIANSLIHPDKSLDRVACEEKFDRPWKARPDVS
jgi:nitroreductase